MDKCVKFDTVERIFLMSLKYLYDTLVRVILIMFSGIQEHVYIFCIFNKFNISIVIFVQNLSFLKHYHIPIKV